MRIAFAECALDLATRHLLRGGREVPIPPKAFDLLALLVAERHAREPRYVRGENLLGRTDDTAVWVDSATVSRRHARLLVERGRVLLEDLGSRNGTWIRGARVVAPVELRDGNEFRVGWVPVTLRAVRVAGSTRSSSHA